MDTCARVNCLNVKVGRAGSLAARKRNYVADFDEDNIRFIPLLTTEEFRRAETIILRHLRNHRMKSPKGGRMDWLEGIALVDAVEAVFESLNREALKYARLLPDSRLSSVGGADASPQRDG